MIASMDGRKGTDYRGFVIAVVPKKTEFGWSAFGIYQRVDKSEPAQQLYVSSAFGTEEEAIDSAIKICQEAIDKELDSVNQEGRKEEL